MEGNQLVEPNVKWIDHDDQEIQINLNKKNNLKKLKKFKNEEIITGSEFQERLREQFVKMNNQTDIYKWAFENNLSSETSATSDEIYLDSLLKTNTSLIEGAHDIKDSYSSILKINQINDLNKDNLHNSITSSICFHPTKDSLAFTTGLDKKLKLFSINELDNTTSNIQTVNTVNMPIFSAKFLNDREILISGRRKHYYLYNLESNKLDICNGVFGQNNHINSLEKFFVGENNYAFGTNEGFILIFDSKNKIYKYDIKISGSVNSVCFDRNGINMYAVGDQSEIYVFDLRKYRHCLNKFNDCGNFHTNYMDLSRDNSLLATGN